MQAVTTIGLDIISVSKVFGRCRQSGASPLDL
jgi:hypothetical protein